MLDLLVKGAIALGGYLLADQVVKKATGKHIHRHVVDFATKLWRRMKNWASRYLSEHRRVRKIYLSAVSIAAEIKKAEKKGVDFVRVKIFGKEAANKPPKVIRVFEDIPLSETDGVLARAKNDPVLAVRT